MKYIFDFDDVLFFNTAKFKKHMYLCLEQAGVPQNVAEEYYKNTGTKMFSLKELLIHFSVPENLYEKILNESYNSLNKDLLEIIKKLGKENCYIVTFGHGEFQLDKLKRTGLETFFSEIVVVSGSKKEAVEKICLKHKDEKVLFIDDKAKHFENLDLKKCPNLKTILYDEQGLEKLMTEISH